MSLNTQSDSLVSNTDPNTRVLLAIRSMQRDINSINTTVKATSRDIKDIKEFIGYVENQTADNPGIHGKFKVLQDRTTNLEHFKTWTKTGVSILAPILIGSFIFVWYHINNQEIHHAHKNANNESAKVVQK